MPTVARVVDPDVSGAELRGALIYRSLDAASVGDSGLAARASFGSVSVVLFSGDRRVAMTFQPFSLNVFAVSLPNPLDQPVISTVFFFMVLLQVGRAAHLGGGWNGAEISHVGNAHPTEYQGF